MIMGERRGMFQVTQLRIRVTPIDGLLARAAARAGVEARPPQPPAPDVHTLAHAMLR